MGAFFSALVTILTGLVSTFGGTVLLSLGMGFISFYSIQALINDFVTYLDEYINDVPADIINILNLAGFSTSIQIILSALVVRVSISALPRLAKLPITP